MSTQVEAVYENGVFRPLQPVTLPDQQRVTVTIDGATDAKPVGADQVQFTLSPDRWQAYCDALDGPPRNIPALRKLLAEASRNDDDGNANR